MKNYKYTVVDASDMVVREFRTFRELIQELIGNHHENGSHSMCAINGTRLSGLTKAAGNAQNDSVPIWQIIEFIAAEQDNETNNFSLASFWSYWANH